MVKSNHVKKIAQINNSTSRELLNIMGDKHNSEIIPGKYFIYQYEQPYNTYICSNNIDFSKFLKLLFVAYDLEASCYIFQFLQGVNGDLKKLDYSFSEFLLKVKDELLLHHSFQGLKIFYGNQINF